MQSTSLKKAELACRRLDQEVRESAARASWAEAERDAARHESAMAKLAIEGAVSTRAQIESKLARVQRALALTEEARRRAESEHGAAREALAAAGEACKKAEEENGHLADERLALVIELGTVKDEFTAFQRRRAVQLQLWLLSFHAQHLREQASDPGWNAGSFNPAHPRVFCQPSLPPKHLVSRSSLGSSCRH